MLGAAVLAAARDDTAPSHDPVKTAARTLDLFEVFAKEKAPLTLTELAARLGSPISSCHAVVRTLQARGYVYVLDVRKRVYPTKRLLAVAQQIALNDPILERIGPVLKGLMRQTDETVILGRRQGDAVIYLDVIECRQTIRYAASSGDTKPLHSSAIGKAMLGTLDEAARRRLLSTLPLKGITPNTITTREALLRDIAASHTRGFYVTRGENVPEVMAISIASSVGDEPYGVALAGPIARLDAKLEALVTALLRAGKALEDIDAGLRGRI
jgi:IclR family transcriptional regulator, acetate operon repressor